MTHEITIYTSDYPFLEDEDFIKFTDHIVDYLNIAEVVGVSVRPLPDNESDERCDFDCSYCHMEEYE